MQGHKGIDKQNYRIEKKKKVNFTKKFTACM